MDFTHFKHYICCLIHKSEDIKCLLLEVTICVCGQWLVKCSNTICLMIDECYITLLDSLYSLSISCEITVPTWWYSQEQGEWTAFALLMPIGCTEFCYMERNIHCIYYRHGKQFQQKTQMQLCNLFIYGPVTLTAFQLTLAGKLSTCCQLLLPFSSWAQFLNVVFFKKKILFSLKLYWFILKFLK